jgi:hypothetical protein
MTGSVSSKPKDSSIFRLIKDSALTWRKRFRL